MTEDLTDSGLYAPAVDRALELLERLAGVPAGLTLSELSARLGLPKNAVFRITNTLRARGYLARDGRSLRFTLTDRLVRLSQPRAGRRGLVETALPALRELRDATRETVQIGRRSGDEGVILEAVEALHPLRISVDPGLRFPLHNNAPGKLLLATLPDGERDALLRALPMPRSTPRTIVDRRALARECDRILALGWAADHAEADEGIHCVAAPARGPEGAVLAAIWVSAPSRRMPRAAFPAVADLVVRAARRVTAELAAP